MTFRPAASLDDLWRGEMVGVVVGPTRVLLVNVEGEILAFEDSCAHKGVPLSEGRLEESVLTCGAHHWQYDVKSGCGVNPDHVRLVRFAVKIVGDEVHVDVDAPRGVGAEASGGRQPA